MLVRVDDFRTRLAKRPIKEIPKDGLVCSAVLVLLKDGKEGVETLLTLRSDSVKDHKGEVSFPGGAVEPEDKDSLETALREASEEVGITKERLKVLGRLDDQVTITGYHIVPWVAETDSFDGLAPKTPEIVDVFPFPIHLIKNAKRRIFDVGGEQKEVFFLEYEGKMVWGATARIIAELLKVIE
jgi:8-oxo-dGTP pyrophosphatase MutT (NUDIX family)